MKTRIMFLFLAAYVLTVPAIAGPASWRADRYGADETVPAPPATGSGNTMKMEVSARPLYTRVNCLATTDPFSSDESGVAEQRNTSWYSLTFAGNSDATGHRWKITTRISGDGTGTADAALAAYSWGESLEIIKFGGDNDNEDLGQLAVHSGVETIVGLAIPAGFSVSLRKSKREVERDVYHLGNSVSTAGGGQVCRVRVDTYAKAQIAAAGTLGVSSVLLLSRLTGDLEMVGKCDYAGMIVSDTLRIEFNTDTLDSSRTEAPSGGIESRPGTPTDEPTDDERAGEEDGRPEVDADDLPDDWSPEAGEGGDPAVEED